MIHNHEVPGSIPGLATEKRRKLKDSLRFLFILFSRLIIRIYSCSISLELVAARLSKPISLLLPQSHL